MERKHKFLQTSGFESSWKRNGTTVFYKKAILHWKIAFMAGNSMQGGPE
jgi:hypothetical protein